MKKILLLLVVSSVIVFLFLRKDEKITNYPSKNREVVAFGDSLIEGVGSTPGNDLVTLLSNETGVAIRNFGKSGDTTYTARGRIATVTDLKPKVTIILLGGNDFLQRKPESETFSNLRAMVSEIQKTGSVVVILGVRSGVFGGTATKEYERLAKETGSFYVEDVLDGIFGNRELLADSIHPNDAGYKKIAEKVLPVLKRAIR